MFSEDFLFSSIYSGFRHSIHFPLFTGSCAEFCFEGFDHDQQTAFLNDYKTIPIG